MNIHRFLSVACVSVCLVALAGVVFLSGLFGKPPSVTQAGLIPGENEQISTRQTAVTTVCMSGCDYDTIQSAVDAANDGDVIKVAAGTYDVLGVRSGSIQVVYIDKSITIQGGYTLTDWSTAYPITQPTILDAQGGGRVIYITGNISPTLVGLRITGGNAVGLGGALYSAGLALDAGGGIYAISATATLSNNTIVGNMAATGGGLYLNRSRLNLGGNSISTNTADLADGGGLTMENCTADLHGNTILTNIASGGYGGGVSSSSSSVSFSGNTFSSNFSLYSGGGASLRGGDVAVSGNGFSDNIAGGNGGGLYVASSSPTLNANILSANTALGGGGGLYLSSSDQASLAGNTILFNTAYGGSASAEGGGGIWVQHSNNITLDANVILSNTAGLNCGGLSLNSSSARLGGNTLAANTAGGYGGGLCVVASSAVVNTNSISDNTAALLGGGLYVDGSGITLNRSRVLSNTASESGGGLYLHGSHATLVNSVVVDNHANAAGSGLYVHYASPQLVQTTLARNHGGDGSGLYITGQENGENYFPSTVVLTNVILANHTIGITVTSGNTATVNGVLWYATPLTISTAPLATALVKNEISGDPAFAPDGFHLRPSSAAIDRGVDAGITDDIDGDHRPYGSYDLGADEWIDRRFTYLPVVLRQVSTRD